MKKRSGKFNLKRRIIKIEACDFHALSVLSSQAQYGGNPEHKRNPGDFNLTPPSGPRKGKSLCDTVKVFTRHEALKLLRKGIKNGLVSDRCIGQWPKNVWSVMDDGTPLEAQLESVEQGSYHGYPMHSDDSFREEVIKQWRIRSELAES
ncbi:hypothetical protein [Oscillatoria acuminata]|uniref:Uncharacterized protein n=1 Tax=Oscillatoria acuminata PCC 6304 TaxID=56110 RepID=K9TIZ5_9CYAN|nr:hypothetical protein [Oscillatoria acuminata]AFY82363.1 hypothetical protein Oscil6304_2756 [Oscillatoria acuminata PCC 6304]